MNDPSIAYAMLGGARAGRTRASRASAPLLGRIGRWMLAWMPGARRP
jgi:hypothetical protein